MQVTVEEQSPVKKTLHVEIPSEVVARELESSYNQLRKTAKIKGFRPGKAPMSMLKKLYRDQVHTEVVEQLIRSTLPEAVRENAPDMIGNPEITTSELNEESSFTYAATVEVIPEIPDIDFKGLTLKKPVYKYSEEEVEHQIKLLSKNMAKLEEVKEARPAREGDAAAIEYKGYHNGELIAETPEIDDFQIIIGSGTISKEFDEQVTGMLPGESKEFDVTLPENHPDRQLAGKTIHYVTTLKSLKEEILPEINDEFAKQIGKFESLEQLKDAIRKDLQANYDRRSEQEVNEQVFKALIERTSFEVPEKLINYELDAIIDEIERTYAAYDLTLEMTGQTHDELREKYHDTAVKQAKRHLILGKIIKQEDLSISEEEMDQEFEKIAESIGHPKDLVKQYYQQSQEQVSSLQYTLLEKKAMHTIIENSIIEEVAPEEEADEQTAEAGKGEE